MEFVLRRKPARSRLAVFPGAFNPPTRAHEAMALAALSHADEVVLTLSMRMPHKAMEMAEAEQRLTWMRLLAEADPRISVALCDAGLFVDMAREARTAAGVEQVSIVCGRDAAERAFSWDYGDAPGFDEQLNEFTLLVAPRVGWIEISQALAERVVRLDLEEQFQLLSSTEARQRIDAAERWEDMVPARIAATLIRR
jgi:nicotinic acid mononucleotide adenylyltransferase